MRGFEQQKNVCPFDTLTTLSTYSHYFQEARNKVRNAIADVLLDKTDDEKAAV